MKQPTSSPFSVEIAFELDENLKAKEPKFVIINKEENYVAMTFASLEIATEVCDAWNKIGITWRKDGTIELNGVDPLSK